MPRITAWVEPLGWMLVHSVWLISVIVGVAAVVLSVLQRRSANARYLVGCVALVLSVSVLPSVFAWVMAQPREVRPPVVADESPMALNAPRVIEWDGAGQHFRIDADPDVASQTVVPQPTTDHGPQTTHTEVTTRDESATRSAVDEPTTWQKIEARLRPHLAWLVCGWLAGVSLLSLRPLIGWHATWRLRRVGLSEVPDSVAVMLHRLAERLGLRRATKIFQSSLVRIPCVVGAFKPVILLPASVLVGLSPEQLEAVLTHELAHVRRHDFLINALQTVAETLLFYHPAIWWLSRRIRQEREHCCDDLAISVCGDVAGYARMLVSIEGLRARLPQASVAAGGGSLVERIRRLLPSPEQTRSPWITGIVVLAALMVFVGSWQLTVGQVSNLPRNEIAADQADAERADQDVKDRDSKTEKAAGKVENLPHKDVSGKVEKPDGSPAAKATVIAVRIRPFATGEFRQVVTTNERGEFALRLSGIAGADASWCLTAFLGNDGGELDDRLVVPNGGTKDDADAKPNPKSPIIRLKPGRTVSGTVLEATTQKPIADAKVYSRDGQIASTDARGRFLFRGLPADIAEFIVTSPGLLRTRLDVDVSERTEADVEIALARGGTVRGRVIDPQGRPVANAAVSRGTDNAILSAAMTEVTDADGRFTFNGFPVNKLTYPFSVSAIGFCCTDAELVALNGVDDTKEITLRISKMDSDGIRLLGELVGDDHTPPTGAIRGRVLDRGKPVRNFTVRSLSPTQNEPGDTGSFSTSFRRFTTNDGRFVIGRLDADKRYRVAVTADDEACAIVEPIYARVASALADKDEVEFPLRPPHQLQVRVLDGDTKQPIRNVRVGLKADEPSREDFEWNPRLSGSRTEWTSPTGTALFNLSAASGPIFVEHPGYARQQTFWTRPPDADADAAKKSEADEIVLTLHKEARLRIRVGGLGGRDFKNIFVELKSATKESFNSDGALNPAPQTLELRMLPPGPLTITIHDGASDEPWTSLVTREVELKPGDNGLEVELPSAPKKVSAVGDGDKLPETKTPKRSPNPLVTVLQPAPEKALLDANGEVMPMGMAQRLGSTRFKVPGWWRRLGFAGNDEWVWLKADERVSVIHRETGRVVKHQQLRLGEGSVRTLTTSADGTRVAIGMVEPPYASDANRQTNYRVVVMSALTTAHLQEMKWQAQPGELSCLSFSGDGQTLLTGTQPGNLRRWNVETGELLRQQDFAELADLRDAAMSADGRSAVLGSWGASFLWKHADNVDPIKLAKPRSDSVAFAPNSRVFATINSTGVRLWNGETGELVALLLSADVSYRDADFGIAFSPDSRILAVPVVSRDMIELWDVETKQRVATLPVRQPRGVAISRDGRWLAASGNESATTIFDLKTRQQLSQPGEGHSQEVSDVRFAGNDSLVSSSGGDPRVWDLKTGKQQQMLAHDNRATVHGLAASPDSSLIVTSGFDDTLGVWERATGKRLHTLKGHGHVGGSRAVQFQTDGRQFVSWGDDAVLRWWNTKDGTLLKTLKLDVPSYKDGEDGRDALQSFSLSAAFAPDANSLFVSFDGLFEFDTRTGQRRRRVPSNRSVVSTAISSDGRWLATAERDANLNSTIVLRDRTTLAVVREWLVRDPIDAAAAADSRATTRFSATGGSGMGFSPDSKHLAWLRDGARPAIDIVEVTHDRLHASIPVESTCWCLDFSPDGKQIAVGHADSTISVWDPTQPAFVVGRALLPVDDPKQRRAGVPILQDAQLGTLSGRFLYDGEPPVPKDLFSGFANEPEQLPPGQRGSGVASTYRFYLDLKIRPSLKDPSLLVSKDGGIANVIVWVVSKEIAWTAPQDGLKAATIRVKDGNYSPRITAVTVGQPLHIENHDPVSFNFHLSAVRNDAVNMLLHAASINHPERLTFRMSERLPVTFRSDQAIWATGLLLVRDNPFVAISQPDGSFSMPNLPPGEWEFRAWHERKGYVQHWPKGLFKHTIKPGDNNLGTIKLKPELFVIKD